MAFQVDNSALTGESMPEPRHNKTEPVGKPGKMGKGWFIRPDAQRPDKKKNCDEFGKFCKIKT